MTRWVLLGGMIGALSAVTGLAVLDACGPASYENVSGSKTPTEPFVHSLSHCQDVGREAASSAAYERCTKEAGL